MPNIKLLSGMLKKDVKRALLSKYFILFVLLTCLIYFASGYKEFTSYASIATNLDVLHFFEFLHNTGAFCTMLVLFCVLPFSASFCNDWHNKSFRFYIIRSGSTNYCLSKIITCAISGGLVISLGVLLFCFIVAFKYPLIDVEGGVYQSYLMNYEACVRSKIHPTFIVNVLVNGNAAAFFITNIYLCFLYGAFWSVVGLCVSAYIPDIFVALFSPFILSFMEGLITGDSSIFRTRNILRGVSTINGNILANFVFSSCYMLLLIIISGYFFTYAVKRRIRDEFL